jgi:hypothetical protein
MSWGELQEQAIVSVGGVDGTVTKHLENDIFFHQPAANALRDVSNPTLCHKNENNLNYRVEVSYRGNQTLDC